MMREVQRLSAAFLSLAIVALSGCNGKPKSAEGNRNQILIWHWLTDREDALEELASRYEKQTGIKVVLELYAPSDTYSSKIRAAAQTNTLPDIFGVLGEPRDLASYINSGHVANLAPEMELNDHLWEKEFYPKALATDRFAAGNQYGVPPGIYGVPIDVANIQMLYNKDLFKQAGLDPEHAPATWQELIEVGRKLKAAGVPGLVSGFGEPWIVDCFATDYAFNIMGEQKVFDTFRGNVPYTDPDWVSVFSLFDTIRQEKLLADGTVAMIAKTAEQTFANGKAALNFNGSWCVNVYKGMNPDLHYGVMPPPPVSKKYPMRIWGGAGSSLMVSEHSPQRAAAIAFLRWLSEAPQQTYLSHETMNLPANKASASDLPPTLAAFASRMDITTHPTQWPVTELPNVTEAMARGIQSILIGEKTPAQVGADLEALKKQSHSPS